MPLSNERIGELFKMYYDEAMHYSWHLLKSKQEAEDTVMEVFEHSKTWEIEDRSEVETKNRIFVCVRNKCKDKIKLVKARKKHETNSIEGFVECSDYLESDYIKKELVKQIISDINNLPPLRRNVFCLLFIYQRSVNEVSELLQISVNTIRVQKMNALKQLKIKHGSSITDGRYRKITFMGETKTISDWARKMGVSQSLLQRRINGVVVDGIQRMPKWSIERALTT